MIIIAEIIGWIATIFRSAGMLVKSADLVKYLVSIGNLCWMVNGIMTKNIPLIASNAICLLIMLWDIIYVKFIKKQK
ncbi:MAG: YgjV family protein [Erysipelotrichales bacterium]|nr:YgjV family protein [Erysipelotrichales bacterium]